MRQQGARTARRWPLMSTVLGVTVVALVAGLSRRSDEDASLVVIGPAMSEDSIQTERHALRPWEPVALPAASRPLSNEVDAGGIRAAEPVLSAEVLTPRSALPQSTAPTQPAEPADVLAPAASAERAPATDAGTPGAATAEAAPLPAPPLRGTNNAPIFD